MSALRYRLALLLLGAVFCTTASGADDAAPGAIHLGGPEVEKVGWNTRAITVCDLDGDGLEDLALADNDRRRLVLLHQRSVDAAAETGERFERHHIVTGLRVYDVAAGDLNGDGRIDLAMITKSGGIVVRFQDEEGGFEDELSIEDFAPNPWVGSLALLDIDGDDRADLAALGSREVLVALQGDEGRLAKRRRYTFGAHKPYGLHFVDQNGDGRLDLRYVSLKSRRALRVRLQRAAGEFGPEQLFPLATPRAYVIPVRRRGSNAPTDAVINPRTGLIELHTLQTARDGDAGERLATPRVYAAPVEGNDANGYALGDFDGDGLDDIAIADRKGAQVWLLFQLGDGTFSEPRAYPSLADIRALAAGNFHGDSRAELAVLSKREQVVGVSHLEDGGRLSYPVRVPFEGEPLALAAGDVDGAKRDELVLLAKEGKERHLVTLAASKSGAFSEAQRLPLEALRSDPRALELLDIDGNDALDALIYGRQTPLLVARGARDGSFALPDAASSGHGQPIADATPLAVSAGRLERGAQVELLVAATGYARAFVFGDDGTFSVREQFNAQANGDGLASALPADVDGDGEREILLLEKDAAKLQVLRRDAEEVFRFDHALDASPLDPVDARIVDLGADERPDLLAFGAKRFWTLPVRGGTWLHERIATHEPGVEGMVYGEIYAADLDGDGIDELLVLDDTESRTFELLRENESGEYESVLHFPVFDVDPHYEVKKGAKREPREILTGDLTGDGKTDVLLLVHDRVLIYPQL